MWNERGTGCEFWEEIGRNVHRIRSWLGISGSSLGTTLSGSESSAGLASILAQVKLLVSDSSSEVDALGLYATAPRLPPVHRPWVTLGMITSVDGAISVGGKSGPLGSAEDKIVFRALRACADAILVGASTVRTENYGRVVIDSQAMTMRTETGRSSFPQLAIVTSSGELGDSDELWDSRPIVIVPRNVSDQVVRRLKTRAEVIAAGQDRVDLTAALTELKGRGMNHVVCEGGPSLAGQLHESDLIDELALTVSPHLVGGNGSSFLKTTFSETRRLDLSWSLREENYLFNRYVRRRG